MQLSVNLSGVETAAELRALAAMLAALYGASWLAAQETSVPGMAPATPLEAAVERVAERVNTPGALAAEADEQPDPAAVFSPPAADVFKPAGEAGNAPGAASAPTAPVPVGTPPAPPPAPAASAPSGVELDVDGIPWDGRIHSSAKSKTANGKWKGLRGLNDEAKVNAIRAELLAAQAAPRTATPPAAPMPPLPPEPPPAAVTVPVTYAPQLSAAVTVPVTYAPQLSAPVPPAPGAVPAVPGVSAVAAPVAPSGDAETVTTFPQIMKKISALRVGQFPRMSAEELQGIMAGVGLPSLPALASRADLIPEANAQIDALMLTKLQ